MPDTMGKSCENPDCVRHSLTYSTRRLDSDVARSASGWASIETRTVECRNVPGLPQEFARTPRNRRASERSQSGRSRDSTRDTARLLRRLEVVAAFEKHTMPRNANQRVLTPLILPRHLSLPFALQCLDAQSVIILFRHNLSSYQVVPRIHGLFLDFCRSKPFGYFAPTLP